MSDKRQRNSSSDLEVSQPYTKLSRMSSPPCNQTHGSITNEQLFKEMINIKDTMKEIKENNEVVSKSLHDSINNLKWEIAQDLNEKLTAIDQRINLEVSHITSRFDDLESKVNALDMKMKRSGRKPFDPEVTLVAFGVSVDSKKSEMDIAKELLQELGVDDAPVVGVMRLASRNDRPGLLKIELANPEDKVRVLKNKSRFAFSERYKRVYIRSAHFHVERVLEKNFKTILGILPNGNEYKLTGHGLLLRKDDKRFHENLESKQPVTSSQVQMNPNSQYGNVKPGYVKDPVVPLQQPKDFGARQKEPHMASNTSTMRTIQSIQSSNTNTVGSIQPMYVDSRLNPHVPPYAQGQIISRCPQPQQQPILSQHYMPSSVQIPR